MKTSVKHDENGQVIGIGFDYTPEEIEWAKRRLRGEVLPVMESHFNHSADCGNCGDPTTIRYKNSRLKMMVCLSCLDPADRQRLGRLIQE